MNVFLVILISFSAEKIIKNVEDLLRGNTSQGTYTMILERPDFKREVRFKFWDKRKGDKSLIFVLYPKKDRGVSYLKIKNSLWMYIPKVKKTIKIPPSMMLNSWMGSDFTNDDITRESSISEDYNAKILEQKKDTVILELKPKQDRAVVWDKIVFRVLLPNMPLSAVYYNEKNEPVRKVVFSEVKKFGERKLPSKMSAIPLKKEGHKTILILEDVKFDIPLSDKIFTIENLESLVKKIR